MSLFDEILIEEYCRNERIADSLRKEIESLPKGYLQQKIISGKQYYYQQWREGNRVKSKYVSVNEVEKLKALIKKRKADESQLKELQHTKTKIEKAIGKEKLNEFTAKGIS